MRWLRSAGIILVGLFLFLTIARISHAQEFKNEYVVEYTPDLQKQSLNTHVKFTITLTNLRSDLYISKLDVAFPKTFTIRNLKAFDDNGQIQPTLDTNGPNLDLHLAFSDPKVGRDEKNSFIVEFDQDNLFKASGNVWEVILPNLEDKTRNTYKVIVHLPPGSNKKISVAKPVPTAIDHDDIIWDNPTARTIYAIFGSVQLYNLDLSYHLANDRLTPIYTEIALPPDTLNQKIYIKALSPPPRETYRDHDGNYMAKYFLNPREKKDVQFSGVAEVSVNPRAEVMPVIRSEITKQKPYLLSSSKYWDVGNSPVLKTMNNTSDIYYFLTSNFKYDYNRVNTDIKRLGAKEALVDPTKVVCVEYSDTFVGLAREKGILSREIEGFGFNQDPQLRPLSLLSDVLHSWPEFYDETSELWKPVDPTWESTSGIDYYTSFDLNHITFAIHGEKPDYPLPAGMYKTEQSKDVIVTASTEQPTEHVQLTLGKLSLPAKLSDRTTYQTMLHITNQGNVHVWNVPVEVVAQNLQVKLAQKVIPVIAPYQTVAVPVEVNASAVKKQETGELRVLLLGNQVYTATIAVVPYYYELALKIALIVGGFSSIFLLVTFLRWRNLHK